MKILVGIKAPFVLNLHVDRCRDSTWSLDGLPVFQNANFLMVDLREDLAQGDVKHSISI